MDHPTKTPLLKTKHHKGLYVLSLTELWERFGFYLMIGILFLYLTDTVSNGGMGMTNALATDIVGSYVALVYLTPFIGGLVADRYWGYIKSITIGAVLMVVGYFLLAIPNNLTLLLIALGLIILGNGLLKPNISTLLGNLYNTPTLKKKKDNAYNIFYMAINTGGFVCNFVAAYLRNRYSWSFAFASAGVGMVIGLVIFIAGLKQVQMGNHKASQEDKNEGGGIGYVFSWVFIPAIAAACVGWFIPGNLLGTDSNDAFVCACIPIIFFYVRLWQRAQGVERTRIGTLLVMFSVSILVWNIFNQNATSLTIWAKTYTNRALPGMGEKLLNKFSLAETINTQPKEVAVLDAHFRPLAINGKLQTQIGRDAYFQNLPANQFPKEGANLKLVSTELFQSINPFWIVLLTPFVLGFFSWLRSRKQEPSTPSKIAWGVLLSGISSLVMVAACLSTNIYINKVSSGWLLGSYCVFTLSEIFLSPMGLSLVSKLSPKRYTALMMGGWFLTISFGGKLSGILTGFWDQFDNKAIYFLISALAAIVAGLLVLPLAKRFTSVMQEAEGMNEGFSKHVPPS